MLKPLLICLVLFFCGIKVFSQSADSTIVFYFDPNNTSQQIESIGTSAAWFSEAIGKYWPDEKKKRIAELLFSKETYADGSPKGIGVSAFRFNIGGGTAEQGDSSGIPDANKRVECFINKNGSYNWNKQQGYRWFVQQAKQYKVNQLIAFVNTPPVYFTQNGLGYKTTKTEFSNLKADSYTAYADFLANVLQHFDSSGIHFNYISPVNEPQWDWSNVNGKASQEGSPYTNDEIYKVVKALDASVTEKKLNTQIYVSEAGSLEFLYRKSIPTSQQVKAFWDKSSPLYSGDLPNLRKIVSGHSYFTENGDENLISTRRMLHDTIQAYDSSLRFWQTEYCMLGDGYKEKKGKRSAMDCALFLAKVIHTDFTVGKAAVWHYWNAFEPGKADTNTLYYLIALKPAKDFKDGGFTDTKNLWALGHYSLFVRPGMYNMNAKRSDAFTDLQAAQQVMVSGFVNEQKNQLVLVAINYTMQEKRVLFNTGSFAKAHQKIVAKKYVTTAAESMKMYKVEAPNGMYNLPPRSITTVVIDEQE